MPATKLTTKEQIDEMREELKRAKDKMHKVKQPGRPGENKGRVRKLVFRIIGWILFSAIVLSLLAALASVYIAKSKGEVPNLFGFQLFAVESGSMDPTLKIGTIILTKRPKDPAALEKGDIVTFETTAGAIVTHRIVAVTTEESGKTAYQTKGDNPINSPDVELLAPDRVLAVFLARIPLT
jgi:signal peptidase